MRRQWKWILALAIGLLAAEIGLSRVSLAYARGEAQQPTVSIPTVTSSPSGPMAMVNFEREIITVWAGPGVDYPRIGILVAGQTVPALGRSPGAGLDFYVQIAYAGVTDGVGWVYAPFVTVQGALPVVEAPPTPTPRATPTLNPTVAAQYAIDLAPTQLPTFTQPAPLVMPTYSANAAAATSAAFPMGFLVTALAVVGLFGTVISILRGR